ncbi:MAG: membrane protein insertion efficiency factor YidD [Candidatus Doudnabacteria bacterium]|nr:membrane protein insertion efficiency factor YidD [Candidatus Doudnabacteria bacterium]
MRDLTEALARSPLSRGWTAANKTLALPFVLLVFLYQKTISLDHGVFSFLFPYGYCKFYPTCSSFTKEVLLKEGLLGLPKIIKRLASCNPGSTGGFNYPYKKI